MGYFQVRYDSRVVIYERKMFIRFATGLFLNFRLFFKQLKVAADLILNQVIWCSKVTDYIFYYHGTYDFI